MELVKVNGNQTLVAQQLEDAIEIVDAQVKQNTFDKKIKKLAEAFRGGMLTTGEFLDKMNYLQAVKPEEVKNLQDLETIQIALRNAQHMLSK